MKHLFRILLVCGGVSGLTGAASAADQQNWIELKAGNAFTFRAPPRTTSVPVQGIDSFVGMYVNPPFKVGFPFGSDFWIGFDYGIWSNNLHGLRDDPRFAEEVIEVDGRDAVMVTGPGGGDSTWGCSGHLTAIYVVVSRSWRNPPVALQMHGCAGVPEAVPILHQIFKTVRFTRPIWFL
jgi:hypothetical protein